MKESKIQKVVDGCELDRHTSEGWVVVDSFMVEEGIRFDDEVAHPRAGEKYPDGSYGPHGGNVVPEAIQLSRQKLGQVLKFLIAKGFDQRIVEVEKSLQDVRGQYSDVMGENQALKEWQAKAEKDYQELQGKEEKERLRYSDTYTAKCNLEKRVRAMEKDLAKVRTAIGDTQMSEILSDD